MSLSQRHLAMLNWTLCPRQAVLLALALLLLLVPTVALALVMAAAQAQAQAAAAAQDSPHGLLRARTSGAA